MLSAQDLGFLILAKIHGFYCNLFFIHVKLETDMSFFYQIAKTLLIFLLLLFTFSILGYEFAEIAEFILIVKNIGYYPTSL